MKIFIAIATILLVILLVFLAAGKIAAAFRKSAALTAPQMASVSPATVSAPANSLPVAPAATAIIFSGDVMLSRTVNQKMAKYGDWTWPFKKIASAMSLADLTVINLESPFTNDKNHSVQSGSFSFNADPRSMAGLKLAGVDVAALANNHIMNQGTAGLKVTRDLLASSGIASVGAGANSTEASQPAIKEANGLKFGFLSYAYTEDASVAAANKPGIATMSIPLMANDVKKLKTQTDVVIVLMHAGTEYVSKPNRQQTDFARAAIMAGADAVVGHHPHWVQTTEIYQGKPIIYSLGNLIFDQMWSTETQEGALARFTWLDKALQSIEIIPIRIRDYGQAEIVSDDKQKRKILNQMQLKDSLIKMIE